jgi:hypothetical protein
MAALQTLLSEHGDLSMVASALAALPTLGVVVLCRKIIDAQPMDALGLRFDVRRLGLGLLVGALAVGTVQGWLVGLGAARIVGVLREPQGFTVLGLFPLVFAQSAMEEIVCRGYLMQTLRGRFSTASSVAVVSSFFGALHLLNPGASVLGFTSTVLIGVLFSLVTLQTGSLWLAIGLHTAWNFTLGTIASMAVSGLTLTHLLDVQVDGARWLTGGSYGVEASVLTVVMVAAACAGLLVYPLKPRP